MCKSIVLSTLIPDVFPYRETVVISETLFLHFVGATVEKVWLMIIGRFLFGIGGASLAVAQNTYAVIWFKGKDLNLVFGLQFCMLTVVGC